MLISYNTTIGKATIISENISGVGVITAAAITISKIEIFLFSERSLYETIPNFESTTNTSGNSNTAPIATRNMVIKEK